MTRIPFTLQHREQPSPDVTAPSPVLPRCSARAARGTRQRILLLARPLRASVSGAHRKTCAIHVIASIPLSNV